MALPIVVGITISLALAALAVARARSGQGQRGPSLLAAASWIVAALGWTSLFAGTQPIGIAVIVAATTLAVALVLLAARLPRDLAIASRRAVPYFVGVISGLAVLVLMWLFAKGKPIPEQVGIAILAVVAVLVVVAVSVRVVLGPRKRA